LNKSGERRLVGGFIHQPRRAACGGVVDDGATWRGFRELWLNERRNDGDFRSSGGNGDSLDKSIHQPQALELPEGKILLAFGQHPLCRRMIIFDPNWLLATNRVDMFARGRRWSVQQYLKSVAVIFAGV
jgi:hypothetical protein